MARGDFLAAASSLLICRARGGAVVDYSASDHANRMLIALAGGILAMLAIGLAKIDGAAPAAMQVAWPTWRGLSGP